MTAGGTLRTRRVRDVEGLRALRPEWESTLSSSETATPFLTHDWVLSWWESFDADLELDVLVLEDDLGVAGIAPLARARRHVGPFSYRSVEIIGTGPLRYLGMGLADRADLLLARRREECVAEVFSTLAATRDSWEIVDLRFLPAESTTARILTERARDAGIGVLVQACSESPFLLLEGTWAEYLARRGKRFRGGLSRRLRRLEGMGEARFELDAGERDPQQSLRSAVEVSLASWKGRAGSALLSHDNVREFFERLLPRLAARRELYLALLHVDGRPVAHELGFRFASRLWSYDSAFRAEYSEGSPGTMLTAKILERAWDEGCAEYDFLRGGERYKRSWSAGARHEVQLVLDSGAWRGRVARSLAFRAKWALKRWPAVVAAQSRLAGLANRLSRRRRDA